MNNYINSNAVVMESISAIFILSEREEVVLFSFLTVTELGRVARVCSRWYFIILNRYNSD